MIKLYNVLKSEKTGLSNSLFTSLLAKKLSGSPAPTVKELEGVPPLTFKANGEPLIDWHIDGNMQQTGTPTPTTPIQPSETGDLSENLYNASSPNIFMGYYDTATNRLIGNPTNAFIYIPLVQGKKYYIYGAKRYNTSLSIRWATTSSAPLNTVPCIRTDTFAQTDIATITAEANENYLALFLCGDSDYTAYGTVEDAIAANGANLVIDYGYKLDIKTGNATTPVYLGETQSTRKIKKYEITGLEGWINRSGTPENVFFCERQDVNFINNAAICSHYANQDSGSFADLQDKHFLVRVASSNDKTYLAIRDSSYPSTNEGVEQLRSYLQQQYSAGTPVTIWYALATPQTTTLNEPIRKIGDYADTVTNPVSIPTTRGTNTLSVDTTEQPSNVYIKYKG